MDSQLQIKIKKCIFQVHSVNSQLLVWIYSLKYECTVTIVKSSLFTVENMKLELEL